MANQQHVLSAAAGRRFRILLVAALALTGLSMRTAVTSVGAELDQVQQGLHAGSGIAGLITTLPVLCFAVLGAAAPRLSTRTGAHRLLVVALCAMTIGLVVRATASSTWEFLGASVLALAGGAISNVLMPSLVKAHFPDRIGAMTALYSTALAVGTTAAAGLTVPIGHLGDGWRLGLGSWAVLSAVAVIPWLPTTHHDHASATPVALPAARLARSPTAWILTGFFAVQSLQAYIAFGWFAKFMHAHGVASGTAGAMVALLSGLGIPMSMIAPRVPPRHYRRLVVALCGAYLAAYTGLAAAPVGCAWAWMTLAGIGSGLFPLALTMIGLRSRTAETTAALSAFVQSIGYIVAGSGPLLFGVLYGATHAWSLPLAVLFIGLGLTLVSGWAACRPRYVDDELAASAP